MAVQKYKPSTIPRFLDIYAADVASKAETTIQWSKNVRSRSELLVSQSRQAIETAEELLTELGYMPSERSHRRER